MADVRSLLRSERASRRITHPHSSYSTTGTLICLICNIQVKSESLWDTHLRSEQHAMRLRQGDTSSLPKSSTAAASDKRKRKSDGEESDDSRKRMKSEKNRANVTKGFLPEGFFDGPTASDAASAEGEPGEEDNLDQAQLDSIPVRSKDPTISTISLPQNFFDASTATPGRDIDGVDEDEWAAFERDIAAEVTPAPPPSAFTAAPTISAPALSASEIAVRSVDETNIQARERKEAEVEAEKEDAVRQLEEEFDEMESLEERVRRLREKREELRLARAARAVPPAEVDMDSVGDMEQGARTGAEGDGDEDEDEVDHDDEGDDDDWDEWRLRGA